jgi:hypothetical protein
MTEENPRMGEIIIYTAPDGTAQVEVRMEANTLWLTEQQIATVFERDRTVIGRHIKKIIKTGELIEEGNVQKMHIANSDKPVSYFSLDIILSVGYRVNSMRGTQFRIWANRVLQESIQLIERSLSEEIENIEDARNIDRLLIKIEQVYKQVSEKHRKSLDKLGK